MSFNGLLINTCSSRSRTVDKYNKATTTATAGVTCRIMYGVKTVRNEAGEEVVSTAKIFFKPAAVISGSDQVLLQGESRWRAILKILRPQDSAASHHIEVYVE